MNPQSPSIILGQRFGPASEQGSTSDLQQTIAKALSVLRHRLWLFVFPALTGAIFILVWFLCLPREYTMRALVERRDDPAMLRLVANSPYNFESVRRSMRFVLSGYPAMEKAITQLGLVDTSLPEPELSARKKEVIARLQPRVGVYLPETAATFDMIEIRYTGEEPEIGEKLVNVLKDNYIEKTQLMLMDLPRQAKQFFKEEVDKRRDKFIKLQSEIKQLALASPELERPEMLTDALKKNAETTDQLNRQKRELLLDISRRKDYLRQLDVQEEQGKPPSQSAFVTKSVQDPERARIESQIVTIQQEISDAKTLRRMKDSHPYVEGLNRKLAELTAQLRRVPVAIDAEVTDEGTPDPWEQERKRVKAELEPLEARLKDTNERLEKLAAAKIDVDKRRSTLLERQQSYLLKEEKLGSIRADLDAWQARLDEIDRALAAETGNRGTHFVTVEQCRRPARPNLPKLSSAYMVSSGIGLALGVLVVFLREIMDRSFRNPARVRQVLGIPVLEAIGEITLSPSRRIMRKALLVTVASVQGAAVIVLGCMIYVRLENPDTYDRYMSLIGGKLSGLTGWLI